MLLSLPSPNVICFKDLNNTFAKFLWCGKPPKWRKEILEGEIHHGRLKLHNLQLFDKALKLSWLKRYLRSKGKWTVFPNDFELWEVFNYGPDILEKLVETTTNKFWLYVLKSLGFFWQTDRVLRKDFIKNTPIWLNPTFSVPINRQWFNNGISTIADFLGTMNVILPMEEFMTKHNVKTNFLAYNLITSKIRKYIEWKDLPLHNKDAPRNSSLNVWLN